MSHLSLYFKYKTFQKFFVYFEEEAKLSMLLVTTSLPVTETNINFVYLFLTVSQSSRNLCTPASVRG